jgi:RHS repeat-associated protein
VDKTETALISSSLAGLYHIFRKSFILSLNARGANWATQIRYNGLGQDVERTLPGGVISSWQYDAAGKPVQHSVQNGQRENRKRSYSWGFGGQLKKAKNELTGDHTAYSYDGQGNLIGSRINDRLSYIYRSPDDVGNLYETEEKTDRIYSAGSRLEYSKVNTDELKSPIRGGHGKLVTKGTEFSYDDEGNLTQKAEANGDVWKYEYYGNGMLAKVVLPDGGEVTYKYDPLGRRIEKKTPEKTARFVWDGNNPLHEWEDENLVTWVFNDGFVPAAKITTEGNYSIITDYLGTPVEAYDAEGNQVWAVELDIFGRVKEIKGKADFIPFRYQGQYHDLSSGLYYNRYRYYDPETGQYIQQDPIGL